MTYHPREQPGATARQRPLALERQAARAHRARRMPPRPAPGAALEAQLATASGLPVGNPVRSTVPAYELLVGHLSPPGREPARPPPVGRPPQRPPPAPHLVATPGPDLST